jgi:hypothetical protein
MSKENYATVNLVEFNGELREAKPVDRGDFSEALLAKMDATANADNPFSVSDEFLHLASKATVAYGVDTRARLTDAVSGSLTGTSWIREVKGADAMGDTLVTDLSQDDSVMIYGSTLEDGNNPETIRSVFFNTKLFLDKAADAGAEILVGNNTGIDEEVRAYIMSDNRFRKYVPTETGFKFGEQAPEVPYNKNISGLSINEVWKGGRAIGRFNGNNDLNREGKNLTGAWGTILYADATEAQNIAGKTTADSYRLTIENNEIQDWDGNISPWRVYDMVKNLGMTEERNNSFRQMRGNLIVHEQRYVKRVMQASLIAQSGKTPTLTTLDAFDSYVNGLMDPENSSYDSGFAADYEVLRATMFDEKTGKFLVSDIGALAMARNRNITKGYIAELNPGILTNLESKPYYDMINSDRQDSGKDYFRMLNEDVITTSDLDLIKGAKNVTYRDAYNYLKTLSSNKVISKGGHIGGQLTNEMFKKIGIRAFRDGNKFIVLDNDAIYTDRISKQVKADTERNNEYELNSVEAELAKYNGKVYRYIKSNRMFKIDPYSEEMVLIINDKTFKFDTDPDGQKALVKEVQTQVGMNLLGNLKGIKMTEEHMKKNLGDPTSKNVFFLVHGNIKARKSQYANPFSQLFYGEPKTELPSSSIELENGKLYQGENGKKALVLEDADGEWFAQYSNGSVHRLMLSGWAKLPSINNAYVSPLDLKEDTLADHRKIGGLFNSLLITNNDVIKGEFEVTVKVENIDGLEQREVLAIDRTNNKKYRWETHAKSWAPVEHAMLSLSNANVDTVLIKGQKIVSIATEEGNKVLLSNGKVHPKNAKVILDDKGSYTQNANGTWTQETFKGGFNNPKVEFQKAPVKELANLL